MSEMTQLDTQYRNHTKRNLILFVVLDLGLAVLAGLMLTFMNINDEQAF